MGNDKDTEKLLGPAMDEIKAVFKKYDVIGVVAFTDGKSNVASGFLASDVTWSVDSEKEFQELSGKERAEDVNKFLNSIYKLDAPVDKFKFLIAQTKEEAARLKRLMDEESEE